MIRSSAVITMCGRYRYSLFRKWDGVKPRVCFIMLNPSTADATHDDPTIRRCIGFAKAWGMGSLLVLNLFAFRASKPEVLFRAEDPVGHENNDYLCRPFSYRVVVAWGTHGDHLNRDRVVMGLLQGMPSPPMCLGITKGGFPKHPLFVARDAKLIPYPGRRTS